MFYKIENDYLSAEINDAGAELHSIYSKENDFEYLWGGNPDIWYGQSPILFPIVGRLMDDKYRYNGKEYTMKKHGFARKMKFDVVSCKRNTAVFVLKSNEETLKQYPFEFELYVKFELLGKTLCATHTVVNKTDGEMYFSIGGHPGFNCEMGDWLEFDKNETLSTETIGLDDALRLEEKTPVLKDEKKIVITEDIFNNDALILSGIKSKAVTLRSNNHDRTVRFTFGEIPYLGIWAKPGAPYVCIEPWYGVNDDRVERDDISKKDAISRLPKGGIFDLVYTVEIN